MTDNAFKDHVNALKAAVRGQDIAIDLGLHRRGKRFFCPACQAGGGKTPDLDVLDQVFKCYKCDAKGDVIDLLVLVGMTKAEAIKYLEDRTGLVRPKGKGQVKGRAALTVRKAIPAPVAAKIWNIQNGGDRKSDQKPNSVSDISKSEAAKRLNVGKTLVQDAKAILRKAPEKVKEDQSANLRNRNLYEAFLGQVCQPIAGTPGAEYLEGRGIDAGVADRFGVRFCQDLAGLWALADRDDIKAAGLSSLYIFDKAGLPVLVFPYYHQGKPVFIKTRCLLSKDEADSRGIMRFLNTAGKVPCLWNHDAVAAADQVIITEGEIDALSAVMMGLVGVGLPGWSHWKDAWTKGFTGKDVILVLDADAAGKKGTTDIAKRFMKAGLPCPREWKLDAGKDLNDYWQTRRNS